MEIVVVGGGPAGLQAALTLGRVHREVLLLDSGSYRNDPAEHLHNFLGHDGRPPSELRARARRELTAYPTVEVRDMAAADVVTADGGFATELADGSVVRSRLVLLATGVRDVLPDVPGLAEAFGRVVHHCPFCHGHELAGRPVAVLEGPRAAHLVPMLRRLTDDVRVLPAPDEVAVDGEDALVTVAGERHRVAGLFVGTELRQAAPFAARLGLDLLDSGCVEVDPLGRTSLPGVLAAGDLAHTRAAGMPAGSVLGAAAAGQVAAGGAVASLIAA